MKHKIGIFSLIAILFLAAFLRLYKMRELGTFLADQAIELSGTAQILKGDLTLIGIKTSVSEVRNGAVMYYVMAPFLYLFNYDPVAGAFVQILLQLAAITCVYMVLKKQGREGTGLIASMMIAASPLLVRFSRQTMLAYYPLFFTTVAFLVSVVLVKKYKALYSFFLGILLGFMLQIHYATLATILYGLLLPFIFLPRKIWPRYFVTLLGGFVIGFSPMILFDVTHGFFQSKTLLNFLSQNAATAFQTRFSLLSYWGNSLSQVLFSGNVLLTLLFLMICAIVRVGIRATLTLIEKLCFLQIVATLLFTIVFVKEYVSHYSITLFIPLFILVGASIEKAIQTHFPHAFLKIFSIFSLFFVMANSAGYGLNDNHGWTMKEGWNLPGVEIAAHIIFDDINQTNVEKSYNVAMVVDAQNQGMPLRYFLTVWGPAPLPFDKYDQADFLYVVTEPAIDIYSMQMWEITSFGPFTIDKAWDIQNGFTLYRLSKKNHLS